MYGIQFPTDPMMDHFLSSVSVCVCAAWRLLVPLPGAASGCRATAQSFFQGAAVKVTRLAVPLQGAAAGCYEASVRALLQGVAVRCLW